MGRIGIDKRGVRIDGEYKTLLCASLFYFRLPRAMWADRIDMLLGAGYNTADVYFPWNYHETAPGVWDFAGERDAAAFLSLCRDKGLMVIARPGPYICSEWDGGALPPWVTAKGNIRRADPEYLAAVRGWFDKILPLIEANEYDGRGGVILLQLENELDFFDCPDVEPYIAALKSCADAAGISVPCFCCAGQLSAARAGGLCGGVLPTYNFYPDSRDNTFDEVMAGFSARLSEQNLPLLVSETNRDHFLLRREFAAGAKLLGAYNQVAGSTTGFYTSVNNWGAPLAFLTTMYDFSSMITTLGEYSPEVDEARIFAATLAALPQLSGAVAYDGPVSVKADFVTTPRPMALSAEGGAVVCVPNFSDKGGTARVTAFGRTVEAYVRPMSAPFLPFGIKFAGGEIVCAGAEVLSASGTELVFHTDGAAEAVVCAGGKTVTFIGDGSLGGLSVRFVTEGVAAEIAAAGRNRAPAGHVETSVNEMTLASGRPLFTPVEAGESLFFEDLGIYRGWAEYTVRPGGKKLFAERVSDLVTARLDGAYCGTTVADGGCYVYPACGEAVLRVEKWGNSNFDDARLPSMRIEAKKGIGAVYAVEAEREIKYFRFTLLDEFGSERIETDSSPLAAVLGVSKWNTTRQPAVCAYSYPATRRRDKFYLSVSREIECAVYAGGRLAGRGDYGFVDLTELMPKGVETEVTVVFRKPHWAVDCGKVVEYDLEKIPVSVAALSEAEAEKISVPAGKKVALPAKLEKGGEYLATVTIPTERCCIVETDLADVKATFVLGGKVIARVMGEWSGAPLMTGGSQTGFYIPSSVPDRALKLYLECIGDNPRVSAFRFIEKNEPKP